MKPNDINKRLTDLLNKGDSRVDRLLVSYEKRLLTEYQTALDEIKKSIAKIYEKFGDNVKYSDLASYNRLTNLEQQIASEIKKLTNKNIKTTESALKDLFSESFYRTGYALESAVGVKLGFGQLRTETIAGSLLKLNPLDAIKWPERMKQHAQVFVNQIRSELTQGLIQRKGYAKIAKTVTEITGINAGKVLRIIRTEGHRVQNAARILGYETSEAAADRLGMKTSRIWIATLDSKTRDSHRSMDGKEAKMIDDKPKWTFPSGTTTEGPGLSGVAEEDIHCRCTTRLEIQDIPQKKRKDNISKEIIGYKSFDEWYEGRIK